MATKWFAGKHQVMVTTDTFGPRNGYPHVKDVYLVGSPCGVVNFLQMAGRGGHDDDVACVCTFLFKDASTLSSAANKHIGSWPLYSKYQLSDAAGIHFANRSQLPQQPIQLVVSFMHCDIS